MNRYVKKSIAATLFAVTCLVGSASAAGAISNNEPEPPPPPPSSSRPNLVVSALSVTPSGNQWSIGYTVANNGSATATNFRVHVKHNGAAILKDTFHSPLAAGASRSETVVIPQSSCYLPVQVVADATGAVSEVRETDNVRWMVAMTSPTCSSLPRYTVKAVSFRADDESHADWAGSDEPFWTFNTVGLGGTQKATASQIFGDVDTGETRNFAASEGCLYLSCSGGAAPHGIGFSAQVWEHDLGDVAETLATLADYFKKAGGLAGVSGLPAWVSGALSFIGQGLDVVSGWGADDLIGSNTYGYDAVTLASRLPSTGGSFLDTRTYSGAPDAAGAVYSMTVRVTRVG